jgi:serine/threonine protein kinase
MGEVYLARDDRLDREVALKVLLRGTLADKPRGALRRGARALKLNHPNIATVFDFDSHADVDFLVMEYVAGQGLEEKLSAGPLREREVLRLGQQLAEGLSAAHGQGVIHRDLKPGNVRLTVDGRLKILDFGLAKQVARGSETATTEAMTEFHGPVGTLPYMAPEQLHGDAVDTRTDIWAAGAVLYEMVTGRRHSRRGARLITAILTEQPPLPSAVNHRVSQGLGRHCEVSGEGSGGGTSRRGGWRSIYVD